MLLLVALLNAVADLPISQRDPDRVTDAVHRVLSRPEYQEPAEPWLTRVRNEVLDWLARVLSTIAGAGIVAWIMLAVVLALVALVAVRVFRDVSRDPSSGITVQAARLKPAVTERSSPILQAGACSRRCRAGRRASTAPR
jgi:hypothetical protein